MNLTPQQLTALKNDINTAFPGAPNNPDQNTIIAATYNLSASPNYWVWKTFLAQSDCVGLTSSDSTDWSWTIYIGRSQGERDAWREMFADTGAINPSRLNVRNGLADIFSGAGGLPQRTHLLALGRRLASRLEKLFAVGAGTTASPSVMAIEGLVTYVDIGNARDS